AVEDRRQTNGWPRFRVGDWLGAPATSRIAASNRHPPRAKTAERRWPECPQCATDRRAPSLPAKRATSTCSGISKMDDPRERKTFRRRPRLVCRKRWRSSVRDRKSTRLNSSHDQTSYAVFCLKKKK